MKKLYLTIPLLTLALIATGCAADKTTTSANTNSADTNVNSTANVNTNQPEVTNTNVTPSEEGGDVADPYEGWQTYTNDEYGFSFRYPGDWMQFTTVTDDGLVFDSNIKNSVRLTQSSNLHSANSFQDISVDVIERSKQINLANSETSISRRIDLGEFSLILTGTWLQQEEMGIFEKIADSIQSI